MMLPPDWDKPHEDNNRLCQLFTYGQYDLYAHTMPYRLFRSPSPGRLPLVVYLHGADAVGSDNELPLTMHDIGTMFARDDWQALRPCHILAPQYGPTEHWSVPYVAEMLQSLIEETAATLNVNPHRIYIYGYSAGGVGTLRMIKEHPGFYAGAIAICGATGRAKLDALTQVPLYLVHAADDPIVKASYGAQDTRGIIHFGSRDLYDELRESAPLMHYDEFAPGEIKQTYGVHPHCSWVAVSDPHNDKYRTWLFKCTR